VLAVEVAVPPVDALAASSGAEEAAKNGKKPNPKVCGLFVQIT
jgi:hypothetical protein